MNDPKSTLLNFISTYCTTHKDTFICDGTSKQIIETNYHYFTVNVMKQLIDCALHERDKQVNKGLDDSQLMGSWGVLIDEFKEVTLMKRQQAAELLQRMCAIAMNSPQDLQEYIHDLRKKNALDSVLVDLINSSREDCDKTEGNDAIKAVFRLLCDAVAPETKYYASCAEESTASTTTGSGGSEKVEARSVHSEGAEPDQDALVAAGQLLKELLSRCAGDASRLKVELESRMGVNYTGPLRVDGPAFKRVLEDNIAACKQASYTNKLKVFEFALEVVSRPSPDPVSVNPTSSFSTHHAPKFVDNASILGIGGDIHVSLVDETGDYVDAVDAADALRFAATGAGPASSKYAKASKKKKSVKTGVKRAVGGIAEALGRHLEEHGWAVGDHVIPEDIVRRVRIECNLFQDHYEQSEIWVGKQADVGAQLSVPSVRGDRVLWMCGGHTSTAPEGVSRTVRTIGEVEPCRLEVKAAAPIKRFAAMKELVASVDKLVFEMKEKCQSLAGIYERSDAMLAIYPGEGARFARHIDNTTRDGRRLTVLVYLNPEWKREEGGALRLFSPQSLSHDTDSKADTEKSGGDGRVKAVDVFPEGGRVAMFYSADVPHEVLPTFGQRHALTIWYYDSDERRKAVEEAREAGKGESAAKAGVEAQSAAKAFIAELMGGDEVGEDGGDPSQEELDALARRVETLDEDVLGMVASITGAPSVDSFRNGFPMLSVSDLKQMRALFRRMGLGSYSVDS
mmetsp:Transcript_21655/g.31517  ORF Transcript_21655/g.31517 Transcript_21655/m.31517 type:complete len:738 (-) Transcript_21655:120-2333(-)